MFMFMLCYVRLIKLSYLHLTPLLMISRCLFDIGKRHISNSDQNEGYRYTIDPLNKSIITGSIWARSDQLESLPSITLLQ